MFDILPTDNIKIKTAFNYIKDSYQRLRKAGVITIQDKELLDSYVKNIKSLFTNVLQEIIIFNQEQAIDLEFYGRLFDTNDGILRVTHIINDDPLFSLYNLIKRSLNDVSQLNEMYADENPEKILELEEDSICKSILFNLSIFFYETESSICKGYSIKLQGDGKRIKANVRTVKMTNKIIGELIFDYQQHLSDSLTPGMLQSSHYFSMSNSYEFLSNNLRRCEYDVNYLSELINTNEITNEDFSVLKTNDVDQYFPSVLRSESLIKTNFDVPVIYHPMIKSVQNEESVVMRNPFIYVVLLFVMGIFVIFVMLVKKRN